MGGGTGLDENIGGPISCSGYYELDLLLACETYGLEDISGEEDPIGVMSEQNADARLKTQRVITSRAHRGIKVEAEYWGNRILVDWEVHMAAQHD